MIKPITPFKSDYTAQNFSEHQKRQYGLVGLVVNSLTCPYFVQLVEHTTSALQKLGYHVIAQTHPKTASGEIFALDNLYGCDCDGYIFYSSLLKRHQIKSILQTHPTTIVIGHQIDGFQHRCVGFDNYSGGRQVANYLVSQGHKRIAMVTGPSQYTDVKQRSRGFIDALDRVNLAPVGIIEGDFESESGIAAITKLRPVENRITAIFFQNDDMATGAYDECRRQQIEVPRKLSIVGFDNLVTLNSINPYLTTIQQPISKFATAAVERLHGLLRNNPTTLTRDEYYFQPTLIERYTASPPGQSTSSLVSLTRREKECLAWTAVGKTSNEISKEIGVAEPTVNFHLKNAISKLDANNRTHAVAMSIKQGLISHEFELVQEMG